MLEVGLMGPLEPLILVEDQEDVRAERLLAGIIMSLTAEMVVSEQAGEAS